MTLQLDWIYPPLIFRECKLSFVKNEVNATIPPTHLHLCNQNRRNLPAWYFVLVSYVFTPWKKHKSVISGYACLFQVNFLELNCTSRLSQFVCNVAWPTILAIWFSIKIFQLEDVKLMSIDSFTYNPLKLHYFYYKMHYDMYYIP